MNLCVCLCGHHHHMADVRVSRTLPSWELHESLENTFFRITLYHRMEIFADRNSPLCAMQQPKWVHSTGGGGRRENEKTFLRYLVNYCRRRQNFTNLCFGENEIPKPNDVQCALGHCALCCMHTVPCRNAFACTASAAFAYALLLRWRQATLNAGSCVRHIDMHRSRLKWRQWTDHGISLLTMGFISGSNERTKHIFIDCTGDGCCSHFCGAPSEPKWICVFNNCWLACTCVCLCDYGCECI